MTTRPASPRKEELLDRAYRYALEHGLADLSLRPLAAEIGSSPRVLLFLFGSKDGLVAELLARARADELAFVRRDDGAPRPESLADTTAATWQWLAAQNVQPLLTLWTQAYSRSLTEPDGPWSGFAARSVSDWLAVLGGAHSARSDDDGAKADRTLALAVLRGCMLDLLATGDVTRTTAAVERYLRLLGGGGGGSCVDAKE